MESASCLVIIPVQDIIASTDRINIPGTVTEDNWTYRIDCETAEFNSKYSKEEIETWSVQLKEAELFLQDNSADTPFLNTLIKGRDVSLNELATRIVNKNDIYLEKVSAILNQQQKELDKLYENRRY
jgi:hypothetical protein